MKKFHVPVKRGGWAGGPGGVKVYTLCKKHPFSKTPPISYIFNLVSEPFPELMFQTRFRSEALVRLKIFASLLLVSYNLFSLASKGEPKASPQLKLHPAQPPSPPLPPPSISNSFHSQPLQSIQSNLSLMA